VLPIRQQFKNWDPSTKRSWKLDQPAGHPTWQVPSPNRSDRVIILVDYHIFQSIIACTTLAAVFRHRGLKAFSERFDSVTGSPARAC